MQRMKLIRLLAVATPVCALLWGMPCTALSAPGQEAQGAAQAPVTLPEPPALGETTPSGAPKARVVPAPEVAGAPSGAPSGQAAGTQKASVAPQAPVTLPEPPALGETTPSGAPKARVVPAPDQPRTGEAADPGQEPAKDATPVAPAPAAESSKEASKAPASASNVVAAPEKDRAPGAAGHPSGMRIRSFQPPVAMVKQLERETDLPALQLSLSLVNFIGDTEGARESHEETYAILPLAHDSLLEVYDLHYDGRELIPSERPSVRRFMASNEAYVLRVPTYAGVPAQAVCVTTRGEKHCWNPGHDELEGDFIRWSTTKGIK